jgi:hypothetical protein
MAETVVGLGDRHSCREIPFSPADAQEVLFGNTGPSTNPLFGLNGPATLTVAPSVRQVNRIGLDGGTHRHDDAARCERDRAPLEAAAASRKHNAAASVTPATTAFTSSERLHTPQTTSANSVSSGKPAAFEWPAAQALVLWSYVAGAPAGYRTPSLGQQQIPDQCRLKSLSQKPAAAGSGLSFLWPLRARSSGPHDRQRMRTMPRAPSLPATSGALALLVPP